jgi:hypothetical protein
MFLAHLPDLDMILGCLLRFLMVEVVNPLSLSMRKPSSNSMKSEKEPNEKYSEDATYCSYSCKYSEK